MKQEVFVPDLAHLRRQTWAARIGGLSLVSVMLAAVAAPGLIRQMESPRAAIPLFEPYRATDTVSGRSADHASSVVAANRSAATAD